MRKQIVTAILVALLMNLVCYGQEQTTNKTKEQQEADKVFATVSKARLEPANIMKVRLRDGTTLKGYITEADDQTFTVVRPESRSLTRMRYDQVLEIKPYRSRRWKVGNFVGYAAFFGIVVAMGVGYMRKDGCGSCSSPK